MKAKQNFGEARRNTSTVSAGVILTNQPTNPPAKVSSSWTFRPSHDRFVGTTWAKDGATSY